MEQSAVPMFRKSQVELKVSHHCLTRLVLFFESELCVSEIAQLWNMINDSVFDSSAKRIQEIDVVSFRTQVQETIDPIAQAWHDFDNMPALHE